MNCAFCPHHKCYTSGQNCTRLTHEEISEYYTDEDKKNDASVVCDREP